MATDELIRRLSVEVRALLMVMVALQFAMLGTLVWSTLQIAASAGDAAGAAYEASYQAEQIKRDTAEIVEAVQR